MTNQRWQIPSTKFEILNKRKEKFSYSHLMIKIVNGTGFCIWIWNLGFV